MEIYSEETSTDTIMAKVADIQWLEDNEQAIRDMLPTTWTHVENVDKAKFISDLENILEIKNVPGGILKCIMVFLEDIGMALRDNYLIRRNDASIFKKKLH